MNMLHGSQLTQLSCRSCQVPSCHECRTCRQSPSMHSPTNSHAISLRACHPMFSTSKATCKAQAKPSAKEASFQLYANNHRRCISHPRTLPHSGNVNMLHGSQLTQLACRSCKVPSCHERRTCRQSPPTHPPTNSHANQPLRVPPHVFHEQSHLQSTSKAG